MKIKSILNSVLKEINTEQNTPKIKEIFISRVKNSKIKKIDKNKMLNGIQTKDTYFKVTKYIYDCLMKYENLGVIK